MLHGTTLARTVDAPIGGRRGGRQHGGFRAKRRSGSDITPRPVDACRRARRRDRSGDRRRVRCRRGLRAPCSPRHVRRRRRDRFARGELRLGSTGLAVTQPALGREVDRISTVAALLSADSLGDREVALRVRTSYPAVDASGFDEAYARAAAVVTPVTVHVEDRTFVENATYLSSLLAIERVAAKPGELPAIPQDAIAPLIRYRYQVSLVNERVASWAAALALVLD